MLVVVLFRVFHIFRGRGGDGPAENEDDDDEDEEERGYQLSTPPTIDFR